MIKHWRSFLIGAFSMFILLTLIYLIFVTPNTKPIPSVPDAVGAPASSSGSVVITPLPPQQLLYGSEVPFEGKVELRQAIAGRFATNLVIARFQATGTHSEKSYIRILWENGETEKVFPGTSGRRFLPEKRAVEITVVGYSMHEQRIFKDTPRKGTLTWEIRYEPVDS